jgi:hypothetical protein
MVCGPAEHDHVLARRLVERTERRVELARVVLVHEDAHAGRRSRASDCAKRFEAAEVRRRTADAAAFGEGGVELLRAVDVEREVAVASGEQEYAVEDRLRKAMVVVEHVAPPAGPLPHAGEEVHRCGARRLREHHEIRADRIQQHPACRAAGGEADEGDDPHERRAAALLLQQPWGRGRQ